MKHSDWILNDNTSKYLKIIINHLRIQEYISVMIHDTRYCVGQKACDLFIECLVQQRLKNNDNFKLPTQGAYSNKEILENCV